MLLPTVYQRIQEILRGSKMRTFYFYSVPTSKVPSPYYMRFAAMLKNLSRRHIFQFKLWQGSHEAPVPIEEDKE